MTSRTWQVSLIFAFSAAVMLGAMGWITVLALRLDRQEAEAQRRAELEENTRLALWRMESALSPIIAQESVRPYPHYTAFYPVAAAYDLSLKPVPDGRVFTPSPLVAFHSPLIRLHFQIDSQGAITSPQVPGDEEVVHALQERFGSSAVGSTSAADLRGCQLLATNNRVLERAADICGDSFQDLTRSTDGLRMAPFLVCSPVPTIATGSSQSAPPPVLPSDIGQQQEDLNLKQSGRGRIDMAQQTLRNNAEFVQRQKIVDSSNKAYQTSNPFYSLNSTWNAPAGQDRFSGLFAWGNVEATPFSFTWIDDELLYLRRVRMGTSEVVQGCWFDWPAIREQLAAEIRDLLPEATLEPMREHRDDQQRFATRTLASMPIQLAPGSLPRSDESLSPLVKHSLWVAWACVTLAVIAVGTLLRGSVLLSERRADFVSAVTHELRTPLTTFRLYLDMLVGGRIAKPEQRDEYLATLQSESERLGHLVENVLSYARLERGRRPGNHELWDVQSLIDRMSERLLRRAEQGSMKLQIDVARDVAKRAVRTDPTAVEQVLFNLVDNACKYACVANDRCVQLQVGQAGSDLELRVTDQGPGLSEEAKRRLFRPFSKSAHRAANSAPGVGLGLALSRRLARDLGGDLSYDAGTVGSQFIFRLPLTPVV